jgi:hypothetical protein
MIIHSPIISGSLEFASGSTFTLPDGGIYSGSFSGSVQVHELQSHVIPNESASYDLGSADFPFRDLYLSAETLKLGGLKLNGIGGKLSIKQPDDSPADVSANSITIGGVTGDTVKLGLGAAGKVSLLDQNNDEAQLEVSKIILKDTSGAGKNTVLTNDNGQFTTQEADDSGAITSTDAAGALSGSFTGSILDANFSGNTVFPAESSLFVFPTPSFASGISVTGSIEATTFAGMISSSAQVEFNPIADNPFSQSLNSVTTTKSIVPTTNTIDLGTAASPFRDLYLSSASLYIDGQQVISTQTGDLEITTDANQSLRIIEEGVDTITLQSENGDITLVTTGTGNIELNAPIQIGAGKQILSSDGNAIQIGEDISVTGNISVTGTVDGVDISTLKSNVDTHVSASNNPHSVTATQVGLGNVTNESKETMFTSPTFTGTVSGVTATHVGLGNVDNTSDVNKPISTATQTALDGKVETTSAQALGAADNVLTLSSNNLVLTRGDGSTDSIDLSAYLDEDSRSIASGTLNSVSGVVTFTRDDASTFTLDLSDLLDDTNLVTSVAGKNGVVTLDTDDVVEAGNLYYTDARVKSKLNVEGVISGSSQISHDSTTGFVANEHIDWTVDQGATNIHTGNYVNTTYSVGDNGLTEKNFTSALKTKLDGIAESANNYSLPEATATVRGGIELFSNTDQTVAANNVTATAGRTYGIQLNSAGQAVVNVPWVDTNTTYTRASFINQDVNDNSNVSFNSVNINATTASTSKTTGALIVDGGVGVAGALNVGGDVVAYASSDRRLKDNIVNIENPIEKVQKLNGVTWDWNGNADELQHSLPNVGVIAQEVEEVFPQLVHDRENGYKGVDYAKLTGLLIEAVKEQQKQIDELKSRLG